MKSGKKVEGDPGNCYPAEFPMALLGAVLQ